MTHSQPLSFSLKLSLLDCFNGQFYHTMILRSLINTNSLLLLLLLLAMAFGYLIEGRDNCYGDYHVISITMCCWLPFCQTVSFLCKCPVAIRTVSQLLAALLAPLLGPFIDNITNCYCIRSTVWTMRSRFFPDTPCSFQLPRIGIGEVVVPPQHTQGCYKQMSNTPTTSNIT